MRTVRNAARMERDRAGFDAFARTEIAAHIKEHFVRFDVVVHPRDLDRFGMIIEQARREGADDVAANLERLMDRRRLMHRAGDRLEVLRVEGEGINVAVPADDIERVMRMHHARPTRAVFHQHLDVFVPYRSRAARSGRENRAPNRATPFGSVHR